MSRPKKGKQPEPDLDTLLKESQPFQATPLTLNLSEKEVSGLCLTSTNPLHLSLKQSLLDVVMTKDLTQFILENSKFILTMDGLKDKLLAQHSHRALQDKLFEQNLLALEKSFETLKTSLVDQLNGLITSRINTIEVMLSQKALTQWNISSAGCWSLLHTGFGDKLLSLSPGFLDSSKPRLNLTMDTTLSSKQQLTHDTTDKILEKKKKKRSRLGRMQRMNKRLNVLEHQFSNINKFNNNYYNLKIGGNEQRRTDELIKGIRPDKTSLCTRRLKPERRGPRDYTRPQHYQSTTNYLHSCFQTSEKGDLHEMRWRRPLCKRLCKTRCMCHLPECGTHSKELSHPSTVEGMLPLSVENSHCRELCKISGQTCSMPTVLEVGMQQLRVSTTQEPQREQEKTELPQEENSK